MSRFALSEYLMTLNCVLQLTPFVSRFVCTLDESYEMLDDGNTIEYPHLLEVKVNAFSRLIGNCFTLDGVERLVHPFVVVVGVVVVTDHTSG